MLTLNNPKALNALTKPMGDTLSSCVEELKGQKEVRVAMLTGARVVTTLLLLLLSVWESACVD